MLTDSFHRRHNYLRISLTDVCNFRCSYCMPEDVHFMPGEQLMSADEILHIATEFVKLGVNRIRLTGGEPLVRKDAGAILQRLSRLPVELAITTNGVLLDQYLPLFKACGLSSVNVSLDTLQAEKFHAITKRDAFHRVWNNIQQLLEQGLRVKLNCVAMKGFNEDEILDFVELTRTAPLHVRFIEFMPFSGNRWDGASVLPYAELMQQIESAYSIIKLKDELNDTTKKYKVLNYEGTFAAITTMSQPFCAGCNRMRLTADGKMKNCLFSAGETDLLSALRRGEDLAPLIRQNVLDKKKETGGQLMTEYAELDAEKVNNRSMVKIGG